MPLLEREASLQEIAVAIAHAERGRGSVLLVEGPAGIGKSALLAAARRPGPRWLRARGGELERELPLGVARQLLEPAIAGARDELFKGTGPAAAALTGRPRGDDDATALLHGVYRLICNLATADPLVLEVDDVQWADAASLRVLAFLARRLEELPTLVLIARRVGESPVDKAALAAIASAPLTERLSLLPLTQSAVAGLVAAHGGAAADSGFTAACHRASGGNPFVLGELLLTLRREGVACDAEGAGRVGEAGPPAVAEWVLRRLELLPAGAPALARAVAVLGPHADLGRSARLARLSLDDAAELLDALIAADLLLACRPLDFVHPVVRAAIHDAMPLGRRSSTHRAAARLLHDQGTAPDAVAMHLLATEPGGEPWVAEALLAGAQVALGQGSPETAATFANRGLAEPPPPEVRIKLLRALGSAEIRLGSATAEEHFHTAYAEAADARERGQILLEMVITGSLFTDVTALMRAAMYELAPIDPELSLMLRARMLVAAELSHDPLEPMVREGEMALAEYPDDTLAARLLAGALAFHKALRAEPRREVVALSMRAVADEAAYLRDLEAGYPHIYGINGLILTLSFELSVHRLSRAIDHALERGSLIGSAIPLGFRSLVYRLEGKLAEAERDARKALEHALRTDDDWLVAMSVADVVEALIDLGRPDAAEAVLLDHRAFCGRLAGGPPLLHIALARSALALVTGRPADALAHARQAEEIAAALGASNPVILPWRERSVSALIALGRAEEGRPIAEEALRIAERADLPSAIGGAQRILAATIAERDEAILLLRDAVAALEPAPVPLELARALIDLGAALRRAGRRREAREPLARALELAHRHGALSLVSAARTELHACGARPRREVRTGVDSLTPSERRVADLAAAGLSNAHIAARLFITVKTTEHHLAATYRKLGISSRNDLAAVFDDAPAMPDPTASAS